MQQKMISLKVDIVNGTGVVSWKEPVYEVIEGCLAKMFSKDYHCKIVCMKKKATY
jgi:hypothetical protein